MGASAVSNSRLQRFALNSFAFVFGAMLAAIISGIMYLMWTTTGVGFGLHVALVVFGWLWRAFSDALSELLGVKE